MEGSPWRWNWQLTLVFLPAESHGQSSLAGYSPWGHKRVGHDLATKQQQQQREQSEKQLVGEDYLFSMILRISCSGLYKNSDW